MSKTSKFFIYVIMFAVLLSIAHAAAFDVKVAPVKDKIVIGENAEFNLTVQNNLDTEEEFTIKKAGYPYWDVYTKPLQNPITLKVPPLSSTSISLFVNPLYITSIDTYTLDTGIVLSRTGEEHKVPITIAILSTGALIQGYVPNVLATLSIEPENVDPRNEFTARILLNNQNVINYTNLTLKIESGFFNQELYFSLEPKEEKTIEVPLRIDSSTPPKKASLSIHVLKDNRVIVSPIADDFEVTEYVMQTNIPKEKSFLKIKTGVKLFSNNPGLKGTIRLETTQLKNLFSSTTPRAQTVTDNGREYYVWQITLDKDMTMTVFVNENYRPLVGVIVLAIVSIVLYFLFRSPLVVRKSVVNVGMSEGGISEAKVVVRVKNRSSRQITGIEVIDNVPHIAHVEKELSIGSMQPHAVLQHPKKGVMIKWNIESLEPGDERVLSYKMKSRLSILGEFNLPAASARTKIGNKVIISNSNRVTVGG